MFIEVHWKPNVSEQDNLKTYGIDLSFSLGKDYNLDFEWYLGKPKVQWQRAMLDSLNEFIRNHCYDLVEKTPIYYIKEKIVEVDWVEKTVEERVVITWNNLYNSCMQIIMDAIQDIQDRWDPLFMLKVDDNKMRRLKKKREASIEEIEKYKDEIRDLDVELTKQKTIKEVKQQLLQQAIDEWYISKPQQSYSPQQETKQQPTQQTKEIEAINVDNKKWTKQLKKDAWMVMSKDAVSALF